MPTLARVREDAERQAIQRSLANTGGNAQRAASQLGVSRATLYRLLEKHGFSAPAGALAVLQDAGPTAAGPASLHD